MVSRFIILAILLSIGCLVHSSSVSERRARVQSMRVRPLVGGQVSWNETTTALPQLVPGNAEIEQIIIHVGEYPDLRRIILEIYRESPRGVIPVLGAGFIFIIACILLLTIWK